MGLSRTAFTNAKSSLMRYFLPISRLNHSNQQTNHRNYHPTKNVGHFILCLIKRVTRVMGRTVLLIHTIKNCQLPMHTDNSCNYGSQHFEINAPHILKQKRNQILIHTKLYITVPQLYKISQSLVNTLGRNYDTQTINGLSKLRKDLA